MRVNQNITETLNLAAGELLMVIADAVSSGIVFRLGDKGGEPSQGATALVFGDSKTFGPYPQPARFAISCDAGFMTYSTGPVDLRALELEADARAEISAVRGGPGSFQPIAVDLELEADAGTSDAGDTDFLAPIMGNVSGADLIKTNNYIAGLIAALSVLGVRATILPIGAMLCVLMDGVTEADGIVVAHIDGGDPSSETRARAAFAVSQLNNHAETSVEYGLDLKYDPSEAVKALLSGTARAFTITKGLTRSPNDVVWIEGDGAPVNGTTGDNYAGRGSRYTDYTNGEEYINTGIITAPVWKKITVEA